MPPSIRTLIFLTVALLPSQYERHHIILLPRNAPLYNLQCIFWVMILSYHCLYLHLFGTLHSDLSNYNDRSIQNVHFLALQEKVSHKAVFFTYPSNTKGNSVLSFCRMPFHNLQLESVYLMVLLFHLLV
jgi:hypothetical protein